MPLEVASPRTYRCGFCNGTMDGYSRFCAGCGRWGFVAPLVTRALEGAIVGEASRVVSARDLLGFTSKSLPLESPWSDLLGEVPSRGWSLFAFGGPATGKSTTVTRLALALNRWGPVLWVAREEGFSQSIVRRLRDLEAARDDFWITASFNLGELRELVKARRVAYLVFDSINMTALQPEEAVAIPREWDCSLLAICEENKDGQYKGESGWPHLCDVVWRCVAPGRIKVLKSRYGRSGQEVSC